MTFSELFQSAISHAESDTALAIDLGCSRTYIYLIKKGRKIPGPDFIEKMALTLGLSAEMRNRLMAAAVAAKENRKFQRFGALTKARENLAKDITADVVQFLNAVGHQVSTEDIKDLVQTIEKTLNKRIRIRGE